MSNKHLSRRDFLQKTAGLMAAAALFPATSAPGSSKYSSPTPASGYQFPVTDLYLLPEALIPTPKPGEDEHAFTHLPLPLLGLNNNQDFGMVYFQGTKYDRSWGNKAVTDMVPAKVTQHGGHYDISGIIHSMEGIIAQDKSAKYGIEISYIPPKNFELSLMRPFSFLINHESTCGEFNRFVIWENNEPTGYLESQVAENRGTEMLLDPRNSMMMFFQWNGLAPWLYAVTRMRPIAVQNSDGKFLNLLSEGNHAKFTSADDSQKSYENYRNDPNIDITTIPVTQNDVTFEVHCIDIPLQLYMNGTEIKSNPSDLLAFDPLFGASNSLEDRIPDKARYFVLNKDRESPLSPGERICISSLAPGEKADGLSGQGRYGIDACIYRQNSPFAHLKLAEAIGVEFTRESGLYAGSRWVLFPEPMVSGIIPIESTAVRQLAEARKQYLDRNTIAVK